MICNPVTCALENKLDDCEKLMRMHQVRKLAMDRTRSSKRRASFSKLMIRTISLFFPLMSVSVSFAHAQGVSPYFGVGTAMDSAGTTNNATAVCPSGDLFDDFTGAPASPAPLLAVRFVDVQAALRD
jgi:hypothetical protein